MAKTAKKLLDGVKGKYVRKWVDHEGRACVQVDDSDTFPDQERLFRRVWGEEWPVVRSNVPRNPIEEFEFRSQS